MERLRSEMQALTDEVYPGEAKVLVFGEGPLRAKVMLIGEAPGENETLLRRPFVGRAGKNLDSYIEATGLNRDEMYVTNTVKFRPVRISDAGRVVNRPPTRQEIALFLPFLKREIALVQPELIVTLGNVPLKALLGAQVTVGDCHGQALSYENSVLFPMYHPASLIYNPSLKDTYAEDMERLAGIVKNYNKINI